MRVLAIRLINKDKAVNLQEVLSKNSKSINTRLGVNDNNDGVIILTTDNNDTDLVNDLNNLDNVILKEMEI